MVFLLLELLILGFRKKLNLNVLGDTLTNFITLVAFLAIAIVFFAIYFGTLYWFYLNVSITQQPTTVWSVALAILIADFTYYWEHRFMHRVGYGWATQTGG